LDKPPNGIAEYYEYRSTYNFMKYNPKSKMLEFNSDAEISEFHDQLTGLMRVAMSGVGNAETSKDEGSKLTTEFFERYSVLTDTLNRLRAHLPRSMGR
jgi:hypothetical protein